MQNYGVKHLALILDGNRRWAKQKNLPVPKGHQAGLLTLEKIIKAAIKRKIKYITVYGFSTENWGRNKLEVRALVELLKYAVEKYEGMLQENDLQLKIIGRLNDFPKSVKSAFDKVTHRLKNNQSGVLTLALSYGGRDEIVRAAQKAKKVSGKLTEETFSTLLDTAELSDPDLVIRTGGIKRLSNFLPWQITYSELYFTDILWPDFSSNHLDTALRNFAKRKRNFGK